MCSDAVGNNFAMILLSNNTIKWRIQKLSVDILKQTTVLLLRSEVEILSWSSGVGREYRFRKR